MRDAYREYLLAVAERRQVPGISALVRRGDEVLFHEGIGFADREAKRAVTAETIFGIASITKSFTALAIMQLVDSGRLRVEDRLGDFFAAFQRPKANHLANLTLHHLMTNSSGLPPLPYLHNALSHSVLADASRQLLKLDEARYLPAINTTDELATAIADSEVQLMCPPGTTFSYSNDGFALLGRVIELVTGRPYQELVREAILEPLGMRRSLFGNAGLSEAGDVTELYSYVDGYDRVEATPGWWEAPAMVSAGFLRSTSADLARYADVYLGRRPDLLSPASLAQMTEPHIRTAPGRYYGYGLMVQPDYHGHKLVEHGGNLKGIASYLSLLPAQQLVCVTLANITGCPMASMVLAGLNLALGLPAQAPRVVYRPQSLAAEQLRLIAGSYGSAENTTLELLVDQSGQLKAAVNGISLGATAVGEAQVLLDLNGEPSLVELHEPGAEGFAEAFYGLRVLRRVTPQAEAGPAQEHERGEA